MAVVRATMSFGLGTERGGTPGAADATSMSTFGDFRPGVKYCFQIRAVARGGDAISRPLCARPHPGPN